MIRNDLRTLVLDAKQHAENPENSVSFGFAVSIMPYSTTGWSMSMPSYICAQCDHILRIWDAEVPLVFLQVPVWKPSKTEDATFTICMPNGDAKINRIPTHMKQMEWIQSLRAYH